MGLNITNPKSPNIFKGEVELICSLGLFKIKSKQSNKNRAKATQENYLI